MLLATACEVVLSLKRLGGSIKINGILNPAEFAQPEEDQYGWTGASVTATVYPFATPFLYEAVKGRTESEIRDIVVCAMETYLLLIGATNLPDAPSDKIMQIDFGISGVESGSGLPSSANAERVVMQRNDDLPTDKKATQPDTSVKPDTDLPDGSEQEAQHNRAQEKHQAIDEKEQSARAQEEPKHVARDDDDDDDDVLGHIAGAGTAT